MDDILIKPTMQETIPMIPEEHVSKRTSFWCRLTRERPLEQACMRPPSCIRQLKKYVNRDTTVLDVEQAASWNHSPGKLGQKRCRARTWMKMPSTP